MGKLLCVCGNRLWDEVTKDMAQLYAEERVDEASETGKEMLEVEWDQRVWGCRACGRINMSRGGKMVWYSPDPPQPGWLPWDPDDRRPEFYSKGGVKIVTMPEGSTGTSAHLGKYYAVVESDRTGPRAVAVRSFRDQEVVVDHRAYRVLAVERHPLGTDLAVGEELGFILEPLEEDDDEEDDHEETPPPDGEAGP